MPARASLEELRAKFLSRAGAFGPIMHPGGADPKNAGRKGDEKMFKSCLAGLALALALGGARAEVTARHAYVSFDTVAAAQKNARADELVNFRGRITAEPEDGVYLFEDGTGSVRVEISNEVRGGITLRRDVRYEVFGRAVRMPFEALRVQAESLTPISGR